MASEDRPEDRPERVIVLAADEAQYRAWCEENGREPHFGGAYRVRHWFDVVRRSWDRVVYLDGWDHRMTELEARTLRQEIESRSHTP